MVHKTNRSKYHFILGCTLIILFAVLTIFVSGCKISTEQFNEYLNSHNYEKAFKTYCKAPDEHTKTLDKYFNSVIDEYNNSSISYDEVKDIIINLSAVGFKSDVLNDFTHRISTLHASKDAFAAGDTLFDDYDISNAQNQFKQVIDWDIQYTYAQDKIDEIDELIAQNVKQYTEADLLYKNNDLEGAYAIYKDIVESQINADNAINKISIIDDINSSWDTEFPHDSTPQSTYSYAAAAKDNYIYIPYSKDQIHTIIKYDIKDKKTELFAIAQLSGKFIIKDINVVGNYLYFIAGENVGCGKMLKNPYCIYRMKNDGTGLTLLAHGDYTHLIAYKDGFYASSYSNGIVKLDRNLKFVETISEEKALQMFLLDGNLYYTIDMHDRYIHVYSEYMYDGNESIKILDGRNLRLHFSPNAQLYSAKQRKYHEEQIFFIDPNKSNHTQIGLDNFTGLYGLLGDAFICAKESHQGRTEYYSINVKSKELIKNTTPLPEGVFALKNICYENKTLVFASYKGFVITDKEYNVIDQIDLSDKDFTDLELNNQLVFVHEDSEYYTENETVIIENGFWYYSNTEYNIQIEERYIDDFDTNVYIAHIRTTLTNGVHIDSPFHGVYRIFPHYLAKQHNAVFACTGDVFKENEWTGISIRNGIVYKDKLLKDMIAIYPDGRLVAYSKGDDITAEDLLTDGVKDTLSFGPILLNNYKYGDAIYEGLLVVRNPRNSIGMVEPGHYVVMLCDGREADSAGLTFRSMADVFMDEGCSVAYNLDGGLTAIMVFMGKCINDHLNDDNHLRFRSVPEIIYFATSDLVP